MPISSLNSGFKNTGGTYSEITGLANNVTANGLFSYVEYEKSVGSSTNTIRSTARFLSYLQNRGYTTYQSGGTYYAYRQFLSTTSYDPSPFNGTSCDVLVVAGGGGGGGTYYGGGGGAGGYIYQSSYTIPSTAFTITIGSGGTSSTANVRGSNGGDSIFNALTAIGGGGGGVNSSNLGLSGGSGGGTAYPSTANALGTAGQGNRGGTGTDNAGGGSGGGGAGAVGGGPGRGTNRNGGAGLQSSITGVSTYYAGGGGGSDDSSQPGQGGLGGGGNGRPDNGTTGGTPAQTNTGGGGGGGNNGGSGIVIVRFALTIPSVFGA